MRKLPFFILLAATGLSAAAQAQDGRGGRRDRGEAAEDSDNRRERASRRSDEARSDRPARSESRQDAPGAARAAASQPGGHGATQSFRERFEQRREERRQAASSQSSGQDAASDRPAGILRGGGSSSWQPRQRQVRTIPDTQPTAGTQGSSRVARSFEGRPRRDYRDGNYNRWSRNWHRDSRYDWRRWRERNRSSFRLGFYYDPFGWSYRRWSVGSFLFPSYYQSRYWLHDPWHYRLPPAYGPYRWVRYWDDAVLVNTYTGEVVDVIHNFFW